MSVRYFNKGAIKIRLLYLFYLLLALATKSLANSVPYRKNKLTHVIFYRLKKETANAIRDFGTL